MKPKKLTAQEKVFVEGYLLDLSVENAALAAGYAKSTAKTKCFNWVSDGKCPANKLHVLSAINKAKAKRSERTGIDADWLLKRLADEVEADISDLYEDDGALRPMSEWPEIWRKGLVQGLDVKQLYFGSGEDRVKDGFVTTIKLSDRLKRLELIGRHIGVQAFITKVEVKDTTDRADRMQRARARIKNNE